MNSYKLTVDFESNVAGITRVKVYIEAESDDGAKAKSEALLPAFLLLGIKSVRIEKLTVVQ